MEVLKMVFEELGMSQYLPGFIGNGFETWEDVLEITEIDLDCSNELQKKEMPSAISRRSVANTAIIPKRRDDISGIPSILEGMYEQYFPNYAQNGIAIEKRADLGYKGLSFPQMAIEIGKLWRELPENEKKIAQARAIRDREDYKVALANPIARNCEAKVSQSIVSSPQDTERSPASIEIGTESQLSNRLGDDRLNNVVSSQGVPAVPCEMAEHISAVCEWSLSQKDTQNQIERTERLFDNATTTLSSLEGSIADWSVEYGDTVIGYSVWPGGNHY
ncbi:predicted protein [Histoplasma mississippiense (nom. inval.)]|uniref:predicted protein n=1 Tax=Ajellomyces capsulatus (strain NAm1 / WU24) TaxID=2059318 RepID=UPI000157BB31|nr:predicted protein [Histoplasma mississippiense (nom. inval.)]EDN05816.1 predicted protein [Histoplasma mississippiense (nom. inval.)]